MQAIITKIIPATNTKPTRIKASCARGSIIVSPTADHSYSSAETHAMVAKRLCAKFADEDKVQYGTPLNENPWGRHFATGCLPSGDFAHVFID